MDSALEALDAALHLGQPEGYVRVFVDGGQPVEALLYQRKLRTAGRGHRSCHEHRRHAGARRQPGLPR